MKNIKLGVKLIGGYMIVALITLAVGLIGFFGIQTLSGNLSNIGDNRIPDLLSLGTLNTERMAIRAQTLEVYLYENEAESTDELRAIQAQRAASWEAVDESWELLLSIPRATQRGRDIVARLSSEYEAWRNIYVDLDAIIAQLVQARDPEQKAALYDQYRSAVATMIPLSDAMGATFDQLTLNNTTNTAAMVEESNTTAQRLITVSLAAIALGVIVALILGIVIARGITKPVALGVSFAQSIAEGDMDAQLEVNQRDEIGVLANALREMLASLSYKADVINSVAKGDLSVDVKLASERDGLGRSIAEMVHSLNGVLSQARDAAEQVTSGSTQVSQSSQDLSQGATESASSLEEISSSVNQINGQSRQNAENATEANGLARQAAENAKTGNGQMEQLKEAMGSISYASDEIKKVVKVIDDIAFQINLLALNANVEAARAGKYGKGFAVVAEEVRNLAVRSAEAVKETTAMVDTSVSSIETGNALTDQTAGQLAEIVSGAVKVADFLEEIAAASKEQALAIDQITEGLSQVDQVTQANTASAEESAAAAEELSSQAESLRASIAKFKLGQDEHMQALAGPNATRVTPRGDVGSGGTSGRPSTASRERTAQPAAVGAHSGNGKRPQEVIQLDDDEFDRF